MQDMPAHGDIAEEGEAAPEPPSLVDRLFALEMRVWHLEDVLDGVLQLLQKGAPMTEETPDEIPRCPVCCLRMPTSAHVFLHQQQHSATGTGMEGIGIFLWKA